MFGGLGGAVRRWRSGDSHEPTELFHFTETEEFQIFEILYATLKHGQYFLSAADKDLVQREKYIDQLIESQFLNRYERNLEDLSDAQTEELVERSLAADPVGKAAVLNLVRRVFRDRDEGSATSLSGKPVIISYLLEVVDDLKRHRSDELGDGTGPLSEWGIYKLIVDWLMIRDLRRSQRVSPVRRREFLRALAIWLSRRENPTISEGAFIELVQREFRSELRRSMPEERQRAIEQYFEDLRSSATLTRSTESAKAGWRFSHNSLREFLVAEHLVANLENGAADEVPEVPISDAMRIFIASKPAVELENLIEKLRGAWTNRKTTRGAGLLLALLWDGIVKLFGGEADPASACLRRISGTPAALNDVIVSRINFSNEQRPALLHGANFSESVLSDVDLSFSDCRNANFSGTFLENTVLRGADLSGATFRGSALLDVDLTDAEVAGSDFTGLDADSVILARQGAGSVPTRLQQSEMRGYLRYRRALTDDVASYFVAANDPRYPIVEKICSKLYDQSIRQRHGLAARGAARQDIKFAKAFVEHIERQGLIRENVRHQVVVTEAGRGVLARIVVKHEIPDEVLGFIQEHGLMAQAD